MGIDAVDYGILKCIDIHGESWKKNVHEWVSDNSEELPEMEAVSAQTIGRRIDQLHEEGLLESCILSPDSVNRDLIIGYRLSKEGEEVLGEKRNEFLRDHILQAHEALLSPYEGEVPVKREALISLISDEFDISPETQEEVLKQCGTSELITVLAIHYFRTHVDTSMQQENAENVAELLKQTPKLRESFMKETILEEIKSHLAE